MTMYEEIPVPNGGFGEGGDQDIAHWTSADGTGGAFHIERSGAATRLRVEAAALDPRPTLSSAALPIRPGFEYAGQARVLVETGAVLLRLSYRDHQDRELASSSSMARHAGDRWSGVAISGAAPLGAVTAHIAISCAAGMPTTALVDDVRLVTAGPLTELGTPLHTAAVHGAVTGTWVDGRVVAYLFVKGDPPTVTVADVRDGSSVATVRLPPATTPYGAFGLAQAPDRTVYVAGTNGHLYRYRPGESEGSDLGTPADGESFLWRVAVDERGRVFGGTYPNGKVFRYDPAGGSLECVQVAASQRYVRSIAVADGSVWAGLGTPARLFRLDADDLSVREEVPLPDGFSAAQPMVYDLAATADTVLIRGSGDGSIYALDLATLAWSERLGRGAGVDFAPEHDGRVYWLAAGNGTLQACRLDTGSVTDTSVAVTVPATGPSTLATGYAWADLTGIGLSRHVLVFVDRRGVIHAYDPASGTAVETPVELPEHELKIHRLSAGADEHIYLGGFAPGSLGWYDTRADTLTECLPESTKQTENVLVHDGRVWLGTYPGADVLVFDPAAPPVVGSNPKVAARLGHLSDVPQDRPLALVGTPDGVVAGTVPEYGRRGGRVFLIPFDGGAPRVVPMPESVAEHSVTALAYDAGRHALYVGTCVLGGLGAPLADGSAHLLRIDLPDLRLVWDRMPLPGEQYVTGLTTLPDGEVWGVARGGVFAADPVTGAVRGLADIAAHDPSASPVWGSGRLECLPSGQVLCGINGQLAVVDPGLQNWTVLATHTAPPTGAAFARDNEGGLYFARGSATLVRLGRTSSRLHGRAAPPSASTYDESEVA
ncbi:hypothetical protein [Jiangella asiatica]|uniref:Uncharacterized protein n=1 Tax=Jiangella asiatica TaxID=2530372 RepID=A0A4R5DBV4_9ACTN|nr:hypothetical protein [Jiangella asiatica]TDE11182.1 hypothetical protein E1269_09930 [Jiangella asiatica]